LKDIGLKNAMVDMCDSEQDTQFVQYLSLGFLRSGDVAGKRLTDRRIQKTQTLLREALVSLIREKSYDSIAVKEILDRANVG